MKYTYSFRLSEAEALQLNIKLKEPITGMYPLSTDWEVIQEDCGRLFFLPAIFCNTKKYQWAMHPKFEWKVKIRFNRPLNPGDYFSIEDCRPIQFEHIKHTKCLVLNGPGTRFQWNPETRDIRSIK